MTTQTSTVEQTTSTDGTTIAYERYGSGPVVALVGGAFCDRGAFRDLAQSLSEEGFTGVTYDRRGRGDSGDTQPYAVQREIEDLTAVIEANRESGSPAYVFGVSSGGALVIEALAAGVPAEKGSAIEVPYRSQSWPPAPDDYIGTLERFEVAGDREGILRYFNHEVVGMPEEMVDGMVGTPMWEPMLAMTYTLKYDGLCLGGDEQGLPAETLAKVTVPFLAVCSSGTAMPWLHDSAQVLADALPQARAVELPGAFHEVPAPVLAPVLAEFYRS
ncbi:MAG TPA: alpha/beta hydrolase [Humibacillus xanthopallidus]|nr:alpha/beta hydrolase [Humibacillus xanthopallidus]